MRSLATLTTFCILLLVARASEPPVSRVVVIRLARARADRYPPRLLFSGRGSLYVAYREPGKNGRSSVLRLAKFNPLTGRQLAAAAYAVPSVRGARVPDGLALNPQENLLYYAEFQRPAFIMAIDSATLKVSSRSERLPLGDLDFLAHIARSGRQALVITALNASGRSGKDGSGVARKGDRPPGPVISRSIHVIALDARDVSKTIRDLKFVPPGWPAGVYALSLSGERIWVGGTGAIEGFDLETGRPTGTTIRSRAPVSQLLTLPARELVLTDGKVDGWLQLFDRNGREISSAHQEGCGFVGASLSPDQMYAVALCDRMGLGEPDFGRILERKAIVFDTRTLSVIAAVPVSRRSLRIGTADSCCRVAYPLPAIWSGGGVILVAVPDWSGRVAVYRVTDRSAESR